MRIISKFLKFIGLLVVILAVVGLFLPASSKVSRSVDINAPADKVFGYINDFQQFNRWSPWAKIDPATEYQFSGPETGVGSTMEWRSDNQHVGSGRQSIIASEPGKSVTTSLAFDGQGSATAFYQLQPNGGGTQVTWGFESPWGYNLLGRYMGLMMDKWVGADYEKGLANLKQLVESE